MKLRNKKTGEIVDFGSLAFIIDNSKNSVSMRIKNLAELNEEWEDYEEPSKTIWQIKDSGELQDFEEDDFSDGYIESSKSIGNYFETREEAEKAVEKLKAFKRLKDKGFRFDVAPALGHCNEQEFDISIIGTMPVKWWYNDKVVDDIHFVFGGEE